MRTIAIVLCCVLLTGCSLIDVGVGRGEQEWTVDGWGDAFGNVAWRANDHLIHVELFGGYNPGSIISIEIWRINHIEIGLIGISVGLARSTQASARSSTGPVRRLRSPAWTPSSTTRSPSTRMMEGPP
jgi:hypothetical protein